MIRLQPMSHGAEQESIRHVEVVVCGAKGVDQAETSILVDGKAMRGLETKVVAIPIISTMRGKTTIVRSAE